MDHQVLKKYQKGQSTMETYLVIIVVILLLAGITKIWVWMNNKIVHRQLKYNESRVDAGTSKDEYKLQWPLARPPELGDAVLTGGGKD